MEKHTKSDDSVKQKAEDKKWYQKSPWIIIFLVVFWPLGVYWMWRHAQWEIPAKVTLSVLELLFFITFIVSVANASPILNLDNSYFAMPKTDDSTFLVSGTAPSNDTVTVNGINALRSGDDFKATIPLKDGDNQITVAAKNGSKQTQKSFIIHRNTPAEIKTRNDAAIAAKKAADDAAVKSAADAATKAKADADAKVAADAAAAAAAARANAPAEYKSALAQATTYSSGLHLSKQGVYDQLVSQYGGKFTAEAGQFAIDNVVADWNANALAQAKTYQNQLNLSPAAVHDQLTSQYGGKFTKSEADYAIQHLND